jgi:hypothetical protein
MATHEEQTKERQEAVKEIKLTVERLNDLFNVASKLDVGFGIKIASMSDNKEEQTMHVQIHQGQRFKITEIKSFHVTRNEF